MPFGILSMQIRSNNNHYQTKTTNSNHALYPYRSDYFKKTSKKTQDQIKTLRDELSIQKKKYKNSSNLPPALVWFSVIGAPIYCIVRGCVLQNMPKNREIQCQTLITLINEMDDNVYYTESRKIKISKNLANYFATLNRGSSQEMLFMLLKLYRLFCDEYGRSNIPKIEKLDQYYKNYTHSVLLPVIEKSIDDGKLSENVPTIISKLIAEYTGPPELVSESENIRMQRPLSP